MGATASVNATSKKYKPSEPIEVKFHNVVKYDDGDEKPFKDKQLTNKKQQPPSLLATAIRILERKPREFIPNVYLPKQYARQVRPSSAYMVFNKNGSRASSTQGTSNQLSLVHNGSSPNKRPPGQKQQKTKQSLYMSLINPAKIPLQDPSFPNNRTSTLNRTHPPAHLKMNYMQPKSNTLPRSRQHNGIRQLKVDRKTYLSMIRPMMAAPEYSKFGGNLSILGTPSSQRTVSRFSQSTQNITPRPPPRDNQLRQRLHPNLIKTIGTQKPSYSQQRGTYTRRRQPPTPQSSMRSDHSSTVTSNGFLPHRDHMLHLPRLAKSRGEVSLNSRTKGQIPGNNSDKVVPLYFRKSLAYSPQYKPKEMLSNPL